MRAHRVDLRTWVGSVALRAPVLTASGTAGHGTELGAYLDLAELGAVVVKSLAPGPWPGNPAPRVHPTPAGMLNSVGLQGPGVEAWRRHDLPTLVERGATVVASIWGRSVAEYATAAQLLAGADGVVAVEVNVSCPNVEDRSRMFAHSASATADAVSAAAEASGLPCWAKLSPNVPDLVEIAGAALAAGAEALVLVNTVLGMAIDPVRRRYRLGSGPSGGGLSGPAIRAVAVRAVHDCRAAFPTAGIVGAGGVCRGVDAAELLVAGADAIEVGTATFADPRAPAVVLHQLVRWCRRHRVRTVRDLVGAIHADRPVAPVSPVPRAARASTATSLPPTASSTAPATSAVAPPTSTPATATWTLPSATGSSPAAPTVPGARPADARPREPGTMGTGGEVDDELVVRLKEVLATIDRRVSVQAEHMAKLNAALAALSAALSAPEPGEPPP